MIFSDDRDQLRRLFFETWRKMQAEEKLEPLEQQLAQIILQHQEYHPILNDPAANLAKDYWPELGEANPFLHMALHQAIYEQISTDRPPGITSLYKMLCEKSGNAHTAEHRMVEILAEVIWQMQRGEKISERDYLDRLQHLLKDSSPH